MIGDSPAQPCPHCSELVEDLLHALVHPDTEAPAHFECALRVISDEEQLDSGEQVCYIGAGSFGIVRGNVSGRKTRIRKRIPYEAETMPPQWRVEQIRRLPNP